MGAARLTSRRWLAVNAALIALLAAALALSIFGGMPLGASGADEKAREILLLIRIPRAALAAGVGMALASAGAAYQALLANPLADPFILGVSGGAALAGAAAMAAGLSFSSAAAASFAGAIASMLIVHLAAGAVGRADKTRLLLTGVIFNAFCFAAILFINAVVTMQQAYQIVFLLIGNLEPADPSVAAAVCAVIAAGFAALVSVSSRLNALSLGDEEASSLGVDPAKAKAIAFFAASLMVGAAVASAGLIGFVGLFVPHAVRLAFGADHRLLIPASGLLGAAFLVAADAAARAALAGTGYATELPVGVITALVGAPAFLILLRKEMRA